MDSAILRYRQTQAQISPNTASNQHDQSTTHNNRLIILLIVILCPLFYYAYEHGIGHKKIVNLQLDTAVTEKMSQQSSNVHEKPTNIEINPQSLPKYNTMDDTEYIYQFPSNTTPQNAEGIIFFAHGCSHSATDWFMSSPNCPTCIGLPEERNLIRYFLKHNFIVIVISSQDRTSKCWDMNRDMQPVQNILSTFKKKYDLELLSVYAFGASSGGSFVGSFVSDKEFINNMKIKGLIVQISRIPVQASQLSTLDIDIAVLFIPMVKDERSLSLVNKQFAILDNKKNKVCKVAEKIIDEDYFYMQINDDKTMTKELSKSIYELLKTKGYLNGNGYLMKSPRQSDWRDVLSDGIGNAMNDDLIADQSAISEEMNVAFARHEITAECNQQMLDFIQSIATK